MVEQYYPSTTELIKHQRTMRAVWTSILIATVVFVFGIIGTFLHFTNVPPMAAWLLGMVAFMVFAVPVVVWHNPRAGFLMMFAAAHLFGGLPGAFYDPVIPTSLVPFWWNISIIGQNFHVTALNGIAISPAELMMLFTTIVWLIRGITRRELKINKGPFLVPILVYVGFVTLGFITGISRGGDKTIALWEVRTQFHLLLVALLASNLITDRNHVKSILTITMVCSCIQALQATIKYITLGGVVPDEGFMIHDDALLINVGILASFIAIMINCDRKLAIGGYFAIPILLAGTIANQRRGGIGALIIAFIPLLPLVGMLFQERKAQVMRFGIAILLISAVYFPVAWNASGAWALPARALRSQSDPNTRDLSSNNYRYTEDFDLKTTRDTSPWIGYGYGRPFLQPMPLPMIPFPLKDYLPHNGMMWVWMRTGHFGFLAFLMLLFSVIIRGIQIMRRVADPVLKTAGMMTVLNMAMLFVYSKFDMQLISPRTVFVCFTYVGVCAAISRFGAAPEVEENTASAYPATSAAARA